MITTATICFPFIQCKTLSLWIPLITMNRGSAAQKKMPLTTLCSNSGGERGWHWMSLFLFLILLFISLLPTSNLVNVSNHKHNNKWSSTHYTCHSRGQTAPGSHVRNTSVPQTHRRCHQGRLWSTGHTCRRQSHSPLASQSYSSSPYSSSSY